MNEESTLSINTFIKTEKIEIKPEETFEEEEPVEMFYFDVKGEGIKERESPWGGLINKTEYENSLYDLTVCKASQTSKSQMQASKSGKSKGKGKDKRMHICDTCGYKDNWTNFSVHMLIHVDHTKKVRPLKCYQCDYVAKHKRELLWHKMTHK